MLNAAGLEEKEIQGTLLFVWFFFYVLVLSWRLYFSALVSFPGCFAVLWMLSKRFLRVEHTLFLSVETCLKSPLRILWVKPTPFTLVWISVQRFFWLRLAESVDSVMRQPHCPHPDFYSRPPTSTLLHVFLFFFLHISYISVKRWLTFWNSESLFLMTFQIPLQRSPWEKCHWVLSM